MGCGVGASRTDQVRPSTFFVAHTLLTISIDLRPLIYCYLQIHLTQSRIIIHPMLRPTHFLPLSITLPLPSGTPITLLPHATPAYFLTAYTGPTSALTAQFEQSLSGLGVADWTTSPPPYGKFTRPEAQADGTTPSERMGASYIIAWINVQNKQGEDKGIVVIWPARLCLSFLPGSASAHTRHPLPYTPDLPPQLQPSPPPPAPPSVPATAASPTSPTHDSAPPALAPLPCQPLRRRTYPVSPNGDSLRAFRTLTLARSTDIARVATEVGSYVDAVAKERERERERIRRERESAHGASASPRTGAGVTPGTGTASRGTATPGPVLPATTPGMGQQESPAVSANAASSPAGVQSIPSESSVDQGGVGPSQQHPSQHFYPSPPQTNPSQPATSARPAGDPQIAPAAAASAASAAPEPDAADATSPRGPVPPPDAMQSSSSSSFDPFGNIDASWTQPANNEFMDMGMDFGMGFSMGMDSITGGGGSGGGGAYGRVSMDYDDTFTDDDFSFFDRPTRTAATAAPSLDHPMSMGSGLTPAAGPAPLGLSPPLFGDGMHLSGPGPPQAPTPGQPLSSPWASGTLADAFTPRFSDPHDIIPPAPDLLPPSPGQTPSSHSAPATPNVQLSTEYDHHSGRKPYAGHGPSVFDPIPFASSHRVADGKYAVGKFALPSPPDEEDRTEPLRQSYFPSSPHGWRFKYNAVTDPRIGVVRKLIGVKRKSFDQGSRDIKTTPSWVQEHEDWGSSMMEDADEGKSEAESEEEDIEEAESPMISRPSTPPPAYLPLGPTLLHTQFQHSQLLPLSTPLRPPGAAVAPTNITAAAAPTSVPTPVSPAAMIGAASEKSKSLEAAAYTVAKEVVENSVWAEAWRANATGVTSHRHLLEVWQADVKTVTQLFEGVPALTGPLNMATLFQLGR